MATDGSTIKSAEKVEKKAHAREDLVNLTSGAREIVDRATANARAVTTILLHPFNKEAKEQAIAKAREFKAMSAEKQAAVREIGAQQAAQERMAAKGQMGQQDYEQNFSEDNIPASPGTAAATPVRQPPAGAPAESGQAHPLGGTGGPADRNMREEANLAVSTTPPKGQNGELHTHEKL